MNRIDWLILAIAASCATVIVVPLLILPAIHDTGIPSLVCWVISGIFTIPTIFGWTQVTIVTMRAKPV